VAAYAKGAPVRIVGAEATGAADYRYVKVASSWEKPPSVRTCWDERK
jgi:hypothetical protein